MPINLTPLSPFPQEPSGQARSGRGKRANYRGESLDSPRVNLKVHPYGEKQRLEIGKKTTEAEGLKKGGVK